MLRTFVSPVASAPERFLHAGPTIPRSIKWSDPKDLVLVMGT